MAFTQDELKEQVAQAALEEVKPYFGQDTVLGIGTGSTADRFIDALARFRGGFRGAVASSERSAQRLKGHGIAVFDLNDIDQLPVYVDGADEITPALAMIKGGGGALTREKIVASVASRFVCIVDSSKLVATLGGFPLPIEVVPMARAAVIRGLTSLFGAAARLPIRSAADGKPFITDNGNVIIDVGGIRVEDPHATEEAINALVGVVENGLFARRGADVLLVAGAQGVRRLLPGANFSDAGLS